MKFEVKSSHAWMQYKIFLIMVLAWPICILLNKNVHSDRNRNAEQSHLYFWILLFWNAILLLQDMFMVNILPIFTPER